MTDIVRYSNDNCLNTSTNLHPCHRQSILKKMCKDIDSPIVDCFDEPN